VFIISAKALNSTVFPYQFPINPIFNVHQSRNAWNNPYIIIEVCLPADKGAEIHIPHPFNRGHAIDKRGK